MSASRALAQASLAIGALLFSHTPDFAASISRSKGTSYKDVHVCGLVINGAIAPDDDRLFRTVILDGVKSDCLFLSLHINSPGGNLKAAVGIGEQVDILGLEVSAPLDIPASVKKQPASRGYAGGSCTSACFFIWIAGKERKGNVVAVHRPYFDPDFYRTISLPEARRQFDLITENARQYLDSQGVPKELIVKIFSINSRDTVMLSPQEIAQVSLKPFYDELIIARCKESQKEAELRADDEGRKGARESIASALARSLRATKDFYDCKYEVMVDIARQTTIEYVKRYGDAESQYIWGRKFADGNGVSEDTRKAVFLLRSAAEQGHAQAQADLALMYMKGHGVSEDFAEGLAWLRRAAEGGFPDAQAYLGFSYVTGLGVEKSAAEGVKWLQLAAERGVATAQIALANQHMEGQGVGKDFSQAYKWYDIAINRLGSSEQDRALSDYAKLSRDLAALYLAPAELAAAQRLSRDWRQKMN